MTWQERHFDAIQFSVFDIELISKEQNVSHTEFECLEKKRSLHINERIRLFGILLPSTPRTVLGRALRVECELVNVCACLNNSPLHIIFECKSSPTVENVFVISVHFVHNLSDSMLMAYQATAIDHI